MKPLHLWHCTSRTHRGYISIPFLTGYRITCGPHLSARTLFASSNSDLTISILDKLILEHTYCPHLKLTPGQFLLLGIGHVLWALSGVSLKELFWKSGEQRASEPAHHSSTIRAHARIQSQKRTKWQKLSTNLHTHIINKQNPKTVLSIDWSLFKDPIQRASFSLTAGAIRED